MTLISECNIPIKHLSTNRATRFSKFGTYKSGEHKEFTRQMRIGLINVKRESIKDKPLRMEIVFYLPREEFFTKSGSVAKRHDLDNFLKYHIDSIAEHHGFNDSLICELECKKLPADNWSVSSRLLYLPFLSGQ